MSKKEEFSEQVILEYESSKDVTLLECLEKIRISHGYEPDNVKKYLSVNLMNMLQEEAEKAKLITPSETVKLNW